MEKLSYSWQIWALNILHRLSECSVKDKDQEYYRKPEKAQQVTLLEGSQKNLKEWGTDGALKDARTWRANFLTR